MLSETKEPPNLQVQCVSHPSEYVDDFYTPYRCNSTNVCEALREECAYWTARDPTLIDAPTGMGKTTFVYGVLIPRALSQGKNVLLISNRTALSVQQKIAIMELLESPMIGRLTNKGIQETEIFGPVGVITYHRLPAFVNAPENQSWIQNLLFVVADEAHFFVADAAFNEWCDYYLNLLPHAFHHAVRIYMTATSWDVLAPLAQAERNKYHDFSILLGPCRQREFRWYKFPASYDHVNLQFFDQLSEIQSRIKESKEEKWLVFVDNKTKGETFAKELGDKAAYIDVSRKGSETWNSLLAESRFEQQVLVTTSVLDCGVNIIDNKLHHVVVVTDSRTSLIQMLGRKRCRAGERVNLYVCDLSEQKIAQRLQKCQELYSWYDRYKTSSDKERANMAREIWHSDDNRLRIFFHLGKEMFPNHLAFYGLSLKIKFYDTLTSGKLTFQKAVSGWLGISAKDTMSATDKLLEFCEVHVDSELPTEEVDIFRQLVVAAAEEGGHKEPQPKRINFLGQEALNNRLQNIAVPYAIAKGSWTIIAK